MHTTIGAAAFHFRVRDGIGWFHSAIVARKGDGVADRDVAPPFEGRNVARS